MKKIMWIPVCLLISCTKIVNADETVYVNRVAPVPVPRPLLPQPLQTIVCISSSYDFYKYVWKLVNGPTQSCPYFASDLRDARVTFTDGTFILCQQTVISSNGAFGSGGIGLQNLSCQTNEAGGFLTYINLRYVVSMGEGIQSDTSYPLYACSANSTANEMIYFKNGNILYSVNTLVNTFSFYDFGQQVTKIIYTIELLF